MDKRYQFPYEKFLKTGERFALSEQERLKAIAAVSGYFASAGVLAEYLMCRPGPIYTRYDFRILSGEETALSDGAASELRRVLGSNSVFVRKVPGASGTVCVEILNSRPGMAVLRDVIESDKFLSSTSSLTCGIGWGADGSAVTIDLLRMPHLLVGGTSASGRISCLNSMIMTLLCKAPADELQLILIDVAGSSFAGYAGLPQLLMPVLTDAGKAVDALGWAVDEIHRRYRVMETVGDKDIEAYNNWQTDNKELTLPRIVIVISDLEPLMRLSPRAAEENLCLLAQVGRASGIHVIAATDSLAPAVITKRIKREMPDRIAVGDVSDGESRELMGDPGAETMENAVDMLIKVTGEPMIRACGVRVTAEEIESVVSYLRARREENCG